MSQFKYISYSHILITHLTSLVSLCHWKILVNCLLLIIDMQIFHNGLNFVEPIIKTFPLRGLVEGSAQMCQRTSHLLCE